MSTGKFKLLNGVEIEMTQAELDEQTKSDTEIFNEHMENLRDLPSGKDTVEKCENVTWPTKP